MLSELIDQAEVIFFTQLLLFLFIDVHFSLERTVAYAMDSTGNNGLLK